MRIPVVAFIGALLLAPATLPVRADAGVAALGQKIQSIQQKYSIVGLSVVAVKNGAVLWNTNFGWADFDRRLPVTDATKFRIASISKIATATALMQLWEQGKFQLDDDISRHLGYSVVNPRFPDHAITFRHLVTHTSSLTDGANYDRFLQMTYQAPERALDLKELLNAGGIHYNNGANFADYAPGARYRYSNLAWGLLGTLVEKLSGERFDTFTAENIFQPLGMTAHFNVAGLPDINDLAVLYRFGTNGLAPQFDNHRGVAPANRLGAGYRPGHNALVFSPQGGLRVSALDLAKFMMQFMETTPGDTPRVLQQDTIEMMRSEDWSNGKEGTAYRGRGLGFHLTRNAVPNELWVGHSGSAYGLESDMYFQTRGDSGIILITSGSKPGADQNEFSPMEREIIEAVWNFMKQPRGNAMLDAYFRAETAKLANRCLSEIETLEDWNARRDVYREQLLDMYGLSPMPPRTDLKPVITGTIEHEEFLVEKLHFQSRPGLYVTGNLYLPKHLGKPAPAILYVCGHGKAVKDGVSYGNKAVYQHHGAWFARNGYVCLIIDTIQLGELQGLHHGTHHLGLWEWNSRGYTPAGVEAWNAIRALDYLETRPEVDHERFGLTGRSGGGAYSWSVAALDERIKVAAPIAGITDLQNHVLDGTVEGHCDCMFTVNTHRWDYGQLAALIAPRPLLIGNTDRDRIFPLDGVMRIHGHVRRIYDLHKAPEKLALIITDGPHGDSQNLQMPVFRWFNRHLKGEEPVIEMAAVKFFEPEQLKVFGTPPGDEITTTAHETFVAAADRSISRSREELVSALKEKVFAGWPEEEVTPDVQRVFSVEKGGLHFAGYDFTSQEHVRLRLYLVRPAALKPLREITLQALGGKEWTQWLSAMGQEFGREVYEELRLTDGGKPNENAFAKLRQRTLESGGALAWVAPRGIGLSAWSGNEKKQTHIRRRFMLLGQTLDGMRVYDIRRAVQAVKALEESRDAVVTLKGSGAMGVNVLYASLFEPQVARLAVEDLPESHAFGDPDYLNVLRVTDLPQTLAAVEALRVAIKR